jgi:hypothetical protein
VTCLLSTTNNPFATKSNFHYLGITIASASACASSQKTCCMRFLPANRSTSTTTTTTTTTTTSTTTTTTTTSTTTTTTRGGARPGRYSYHRIAALRAERTPRPPALHLPRFVVPRAPRIAAARRSRRRRRSWQRRLQDVEELADDCEVARRVLVPLRLIRQVLRTVCWKHASAQRNTKHAGSES